MHPYGIYTAHTEGKYATADKTQHKSHFMDVGVSADPGLGRTGELPPPH